MKNPPSPRGRAPNGRARQGRGELPAKQNKKEREGMIIIPAIDISAGQCVRLYKGDFATAHKVANSAPDTARSFLEAGASIIHVVDLDGAKEGRRRNWETIEEILKTGAKIELGGGIRDMETVAFYLDRGVERVVLGSAALSSPQFVKEAVSAYGGRIVVGIDAKGGFAASSGWLTKSDVYFTELAKAMEAMGVANIIFTDIDTDGMLTGPATERLLELQAAVSCRITASGGIRDLSHIKALLDLGVYAAIAGKSVYSGTLDLKEAIKLCEKGA